MTARQGITLDKWIAQKGPLPSVQAAKIACRLALLMEEEARKRPGERPSVIHPGRILLRNDGGLELLPLDEVERSLPVAAGFPAYVSPEEIRGAPGDIRSALYSLGCTLFELVTGTPPFGGGEPKEILKAHLEEGVPDPHAFVEDIDERLSETLRELLYKDPELRIQSAAELVRRLKPLIEEGAVAAKAKPAAPRPKAAPKAPAARAGGAARPKAAVAPRGAPSRAQVAGGRARTGMKAGLGRSGSARASLAGRRGRVASRNRAEFADPESEEAGVRPAFRPKRSYPFTFIGLAVGVVLSLVLVLVGVKRSRELPLVEAEIRREIAAKELARRKKEFADEIARHAEEMKRLEQRVKEILSDEERSPGMKLAAIEKILQQDVGEYPVCSLPGAVALAQPTAALELAQDQQGGSGAVSEGGSGESDAGFERYRKAFEQLRAAGRWGDALKKIREAEMEFSATHGEEIDRLYFGLEKELVARWDKDQKRALALIQDGKYTEALEILNAAVRYGDAGIRKQAEELIRECQRLAVAAGPRREGGGEGGEAENGDDEFGDLEKEFLKRTGGAAQAGGDREKPEEKPKRLPGDDESGEDL